MKIIELRIGNIVGFKNRDDCYCVVTDLSSAGGIHLIRKFYDGDEDDQPEVIDDITPIPLTEEWLLKFGFNNINSKEYGIKCGSCWMSLSNPKDMGEWQDCYCWIFDRFKFIELKYVHQLQNLYFALTGEELTILNTL
jgi:hypothetical protein